MPTYSAFDITLLVTGTAWHFNIDQSAETPYRQRYIRAEPEQELLQQQSDLALKSRPDWAATYQSSWADGAQWWKPLLSKEVNSYFQSNHMDTWTEPGKIVPLNQVVDAANTGIHDNCVTSVGAAGLLYAIGSTAVDDATMRDVFVWTPGSDAFVQASGYSSGMVTADDPMAMVFDPSDSKHYLITDGDAIVRFEPGTGEDKDWITTGFTTYVGANIFLQNQNLMFYSGDKLYTITKGTPAVAQAYNDGMGPDLLNDVSFAGTNPIFRKNLRLAVSTPQGIYYVKNTYQGGQPQAWIFRVDKDSAGSWVGNPIGVLPLGSVALSVTSHLGSLIITSSPDWQAIFDNDTKEAEIELYFAGNEGMGSLGSMLGGRAELDETPYAILGTNGPLLYIGGQKRLWVYDAIRGGLHTAWEWDTELTHGAYVSMAWVLDSDGDAATIYLGRDRIERTKTSKVSDPKLTTDFGDDETYYTLESNYFDANLPLEPKLVNKIEILFDPGDANQLFTVQVATDDAAFADSTLQDESDYTMGSGYGLGWVGANGRRFRYNLIYETKTAVKLPLRAIMVGFVGGEIVREWEFVFNGNEILNEDNEVIDPEDILTNLRAVAGDTRIYGLIDNYTRDGDVDVAQGASTQVNVKVVSAVVIKTSRSESQLHITLREDPFFTTV